MSNQPNEKVFSARKDYLLTTMEVEEFRKVKNWKVLRLFNKIYGLIFIKNGNEKLMIKNFKKLFTTKNWKRENVNKKERI
jgi:hypothetical protein